MRRPLVPGGQPLRQEPVGLWDEPDSLPGYFH